MGSSFSLKYTLNHDFFLANQWSSTYLAIELLPPGEVKLSEILPSAIYLVIDRSGSMKKQKLDSAKTAAIQLIRQLNPSDYLGLITFSSRVERVALLGRVQSADMEFVEKEINNVKASGGTELYQALLSAFQDMSSFIPPGEKLVKRVIMLSDGQPTDFVRNERYIELARRMREGGVSLITLGIGSSYNEDLLTSLAEYSGGTWKHIASSADIPSIFSDRLEEARTVIKVLPDIQIILTKDASMYEVYKSVPEVYLVKDINKKGNEYTIPLSDILAGEQQILVASLNIPPRPEGICRLAQVQIADEPESKKEIIVTYTSDSNVCNIENNAFPRGIFLSSKTQVLTRLGISGDRNALSEAEKQAETVLRDNSLTREKVVLDATIKAKETIQKSKHGLSDEELKIAKEEMTRIRRSG